MRDAVRLTALTVFLSGFTVAAAGLRPEVEVGWTAYVTATEERMARELSAPGGFLAVDFTSSGAADRQAALAGGVVVRPVETVDASGDALGVPSAMVHHWRGLVFIPRTTVGEVLTRLMDRVPPQPDVLQSTILERSPNQMLVALRLQRTRIITAVFNTEHIVTFVRLNSDRAISTSVATKVAEVENAGTPRERELAPGDDRGFLWRLNAYWRYQQISGGVLAECESISLSRSVPFVVRYFVGPLVESTARESMERTLTAVRQSGN
ncbi:MAG TPA: hypothetical protein VLT86_05380 [Vicinamibacterales bacterium]|nr:hypothetical protein [Vicinamibacterales bacterium]